MKTQKARNLKNLGLCQLTDKVNFIEASLQKRAGKGKVYNIHGEQQCFKQMP